MGRRLATCICFVAILACCGWMFAQAPLKPATDGEPKTKLPADAKPAGELEQILKERGYAAIPLERSQATYVVVVCSVRDKKLRLALDTGAPVSLLDETQTEKLKIDWEKTNDFGAPGGDAGGSYTKSCKIEVMELNGFKAHGIRFYNHDLASANKALLEYKEQPIDGLLGWDVLREYSAIIDVRALRVYLRARN
jgi:hypothetical protein